MKMSESKRTIKPLAAAIKAVLMVSPGFVAAGAYAQSAADPKSSDALEEIAVYGKAIHYRPDDQTTGTGLQMQVVDAPVSIAVVTDAMLKEADARTIYEIADLVPGLSQSGEGFGLAVLRLRGQNVAQPRIDGINYSTSQFVDSYALDRIEVVRGPATVLYGVTGAFGGEINQVLKKPKADFSAELGFSDAQFTGRRWQADVTGAIPGTDDKLKVRVVGAYTTYGTFQDLSVPAHNIDKLLSGTVSYDFTDKTSASISSYRGERSFDPTDGCPLAYDAATNKMYFPYSINPKNYYCGDPKQNRVSNTDEFTSATFKHSFDREGWYTSANVAYAKSATPLKYVYGYGPMGLYTPPQETDLYSYNRRVDRRTMTANVSLGGKFDILERTHEFFAAIEYQKEDDVTKNYVSSGLGAMNVFRDGGKGILADGTPIPFIPDTPLSNSRPTDAKELRGSFQLLLHPFDRWDFLLGVLAQNTKQSQQTIWFTPANANTDSRISETDVVKRFGVTHDLLHGKGDYLSAAKTYFSYAEGFQPNIGVFDADGVSLTDPQRMKSYELGLKTQWFNSRIDMDLAVYHATRTKIPVNNPVVNGTGTFSTTTLSGKNNYDGVEFQLVGEILPGWNESLNYTFTRNRQQTLVIPEALAVADVPKHAIGLLSSYEFLVGPLKGAIIGATVTRKIDSPLLDNANDFANYNLDPHDQVLVSGTVVNFRVSYRGFSGPLHGLELYGVVNNAFDEKFPYSINGTSLYTITYMPPRSSGGGFNFKF